MYRLLFLFHPRAPDPKKDRDRLDGLLLFWDQKSKQKNLHQNKLDGVSIDLSALITHFGGVLSEDLVLLIYNRFFTGKNVIQVCNNLIFMTNSRLQAAEQRYLCRHDQAGY